MFPARSTVVTSSMRFSGHRLVSISVRSGSVMLIRYLVSKKHYSSYSLSSGASVGLENSMR